MRLRAAGCWPARPTLHSSAASPGEGVLGCVGGVSLCFQPVPMQLRKVPGDTGALRALGRPLPSVAQLGSPTFHCLQGHCCVRGLYGAPCARPPTAAHGLGPSRGHSAAADGSPLGPLWLLLLLLLCVSAPTKRLCRCEGSDLGCERAELPVRSCACSAQTGLTHVPPASVHPLISWDLAWSNRAKGPGLLASSSVL